MLAKSASELLLLLRFFLKQINMQTFLAQNHKSFPLQFLRVLLILQLENPIIVQKRSEIPFAVVIKAERLKEKHSQVG